MDFASRISVLCFGASYAICLLAEIGRFVWPGRIVRWIATAAAAAGLLAHSLFLLHRGWTVGRLPIGNQFDSLIFVSWLTAVIYFYLLLRDRRLSAGVFLLPVTLAILGLASNLTDKDAASATSGVNVVETAHGLLLLVGGVLVLTAGLFSLMYLIKLRQLRQGVLLARIRLPALERLDRWSSVAVYVSWPMLTIGLGLGFVLHELSMTDPKVVTSMAAWLILTVLAHYRYQPEHRGRRVALLTVLAAGAMLIVLLGDAFFGTAHQVRSQPNEFEGPTATNVVPEGVENIARQTVEVRS